MKYIVHVHNEHANLPTESDGAFFGPYTLEEAKAKLADHVTSMGDGDYKLDENGMYAGFDAEALNDNNRDDDMVSEIWAEIAILE